VILSSLRLKNFGIFYGDQSLALERGLYVIHGRNGRGKTTILNAVRWALYGEYEDRQGRQVPPEVTLNRQARREGTKEFSVELTLEEGQDAYLLRRSQVISAAGSPSSDLYMERNGTSLGAGDRKRAVTQLLSKEVSRFFLFDGEQLQNYEALLFQDGTTVIKQSIEQILGLPVLDNALLDLAAVKTELNKRLSRQALQDQKLQQVALRAQQLEAELASKKADIEQLHRQHASQEAVITKCDAYLQRYESSLEQLKNLEALDEKVGELQREQKTLRSEMAEDLRLAWRDVLAAAVAPKVHELQAALQRSEEARAAQTERRQVERSLGEGRCVTCNRPLDSEHEAHLTEALLRLPKADDEALQPDPHMVQRLTLLSGVINTGHASAAIRLDRKTAELDSEELVVRQESERLREALQNLPESEVNKATRERDAAQQQVGRLQSALEGADLMSKEIQDRLDRAQEELRKANVAAGGPKAELARAIEIAEDLRHVFEAAKGTYRDELRDAVESSATEVFAQLTNEPAYARLQINDNYGLQILDKAGDIVTGRSAGQEQVVALSLIAALNRNATRQGPVMMDTPFGRLDPEHRANILRFLSHIADQVFLLVHGGEVTDSDLAAIGASINEQYNLRRDDTDRTAIVVRGAHD
jgi:DNA sulfur modification protein DndD